MKTRKITLLIVAFTAIYSTYYSQVWLKLACGSYSSLGLRSDSTLWAWGDNTYGQLSTGDTLPRTHPVQIGLEHNWIDIASGSRHCLAIKSNGTLWAWGSNTNGEVGAGDSIHAKMTIPIQIGTANDWKTIACGSFHSMAIKTNGTLWTWGYNLFKTLGVNDFSDRYSPVQVGLDTGWMKISGGEYHSLAIKKDSSLWAWGWNASGLVGDSAHLGGYLPPAKIGKDTNWVDVSAGGFFSMGRKSDKTIWSWGTNHEGELGCGYPGSVIRGIMYPSQMGTDHDWEKITAGYMWGFAIKSDSSLYGWGYNYRNPLGIGGGTAASKYAPFKIGSDDNWVHIATSKGFLDSEIKGVFTLGLKKQRDRICTTGSNDYGQLGGSNVASRSVFSCGYILAGVSDNSIIKNKELSIYPNPFIDRVTIEMPELVKESTIIIYDINGREVIVQKMSAKKSEIDISSLSSGTYFLKLINTNGVEVKKIVKSNSASF